MMNGWIDSHCHPQYFDLNDQSWAKSVEGLAHFLMVSVELSDAQRLKELSKLFPQSHWSLGVHPCHTHESALTKDLILFEDHVKTYQPDALGETGLDFYHDQSHSDIQHQLFEEHLRLGHLYKKPVIVHTRNAGPETIAVLKKFSHARGVIHCFTESLDFAKQVIDLGWMISFSGILTFPKAIDLQKVAQYVPDDCIMIETDAPYLAPVPYRGKTNQPCYVQYTGEYLAVLRHTTAFKLKNLLEENYFSFLKINA